MYIKTNSFKLLIDENTEINPSFNTPLARG